MKAGEATSPRRLGFASLRRQLPTTVKPAMRGRLDEHESEEPDCRESRGGGGPKETFPKTSGNSTHFCDGVKQITARLRLSPESDSSLWHGQCGRALYSMPFPSWAVRSLLGCRLFLVRCLSALQVISPMRSRRPPGPNACFEGDFSRPGAENGCKINAVFAITQCGEFGYSPFSNSRGTRMGRGSRG